MEARLVVTGLKGTVLSFMSVALLNLALLHISNLCLLHGLQDGVPNVWTVDSGLPCHKMEHFVGFLTSLAVTVPGFQFISVAAKELATDVLFFRSCLTTLEDLGSVLLEPGLSSTACRPHVDVFGVDMLHLVHCCMILS